MSLSLHGRYLLAQSAYKMGIYDEARLALTEDKGGEVILALVLSPLAPNSGHLCWDSTHSFFRSQYLKLPRLLTKETFYHQEALHYCGISSNL